MHHYNQGMGSMQCGDTQANLRLQLYTASASQRAHPIGDHVGQIRACWAQGLDLPETLDTALQTVHRKDEAICGVRKSGSHL